MTERIYLGWDDDEGEVLRALLEMVDNPRDIVWVPEDRAVDVPDDVAAKFLAPAKKATKKATKAAKSTPPPPAEEE